MLQGVSGLAAGLGQVGHACGSDAHAHAHASRGCAQARFLRARLLLLCGRFDAAAEVAASAAAAGGRRQAATAAASHLQAAAADASRSAAAARRALAAGRAASAHLAATSALAAAPQSAALRLLRARAALALGRLHDALQDAAAALRCSPRASPAPLLLLADAYTALLPARDGLAAAEHALAGCLRGSPGDEDCSAALGRVRALHRAWAAADAAAELDARAAALADVASLAEAEAASGTHSASSAAAYGALCALFSEHARAAAGARADDAVRWCGEALEAAERERRRGAPGAPSAAAAAALHRAWAHLSRCRGDGDSADGLADAVACISAASADALAARAHIAAATAEDASADGGAEVLTQAMRELDAAIAAATAAGKPAQEAEDDYYALLNVTRADADSMEPAAWAALLRRSYRRAALLWHPDKWPADDPVASAAAAARFVRLAEAYRTLADAALRAAYDAAVARGGESMRVGDRTMSFATGDAGAGGPGGSGWQFRYDKRDVDARGFAIGVWEHAASGARRRGERDTRPKSSAGPDPCAAGGAAAGRCLPGTAPRRRPDGAAEPLHPPPALRAGAPHGAAFVATLVRNHFGLQSLLLEFSLPPAAGGATLAWRPPALAGLRIRPHDKLSYEVKWLSVALAAGASEPDGDEAADAPPPPAFVAVDVLLPGGGALLHPRGAADQWGVSAAASTDLRDAMERHGAAGWLERSIRVPSLDDSDDDGVAAQALLFACAHSGASGAVVRAAVRDIRMHGPDGALKAILLDGDAPNE